MSAHQGLGGDRFLFLGPFEKVSPDLLPTATQDNQLLSLVE